MTITLFGVPLAVVALFVSLLGLVAAVISLLWQVAKHFLDGGRVKVYLNTAIWEPGYMIAIRRSGHFSFHNDETAKSVIGGSALEVAQLVVENPGRTAVTVYSPGLSIKGSGKSKHSIVPRMFSTGDAFGPDCAVTDPVFRLEPYSRVTFLLDYWSIVPNLIQKSPAGEVEIRGHVGVAGRSSRPQKSSWRRRWKIGKGMYTAIEGSPRFTPFSVIWREIYVRLPEWDEGNSENDLSANQPLTREQLSAVLDSAMSNFESRPKEEDFKSSLEESAKKYGDQFPILGIGVYKAYEALDRMEGNLTGWTEGLFHFRHKRGVDKVPPNDECADGK